MNDILLTSGYGLDTENGDFRVGDCLKQSQMLLLETSKGEWKQSPEMGVGLVSFLEDYDMTRAAREIREQFSKDGMRVERIRIEGTVLNVDAQWR